MTRTEKIRSEIFADATPLLFLRNLYMSCGYAAHFDDANVLARAYALRELFVSSPKKVYDNDLILGSLLSITQPKGSIPDAELERADAICASYGDRTFITNCDHFAADYETFLADGIPGTLRRIKESMAAHKNDSKAQTFLQAAEISMRAFSDMIKGYAEKAFEKGLTEASEACIALTKRAPETFREALQLVWMSYIAFCMEGRYAMAFGRMDQYLYPYFAKDIESGVLTAEQATELLTCTLYKITERKRVTSGDDVSNIAIGGVKKDGFCAVNPLSYCILEAVKRCNVPGPNLSARIDQSTPDDFLDKCLQVIGTGLGYPALMNDAINIAALARQGYPLEDAREYCMVGCIENFLQGRQPPWSDGRFNTPKYLELALNRGVDMLTGVQMGPDTGDVSEMRSMEDVIDAFKTQLKQGAAEYMAFFRNANEKLRPENAMSPFLSCFCRDCIGRGRDINDGGALFPSVHGVACMGLSVVADSLASIEKLVFIEKKMTLSHMRECLINNFNGFETERAMMLKAPKYGNDDDFVDKYAVQFVSETEKLFKDYRTYDGGRIYTAIAANTQNISAGLLVAATPDGRRAREALNDAASPMHGQDKCGPTCVILSTTKPDFSYVATGSVMNQKFTPEMFTDPEKRSRLCAMLRVYFARGGQEMQINSVSREVLLDAMEHPEGYEDLIVRVSGFSARYTALGREVQEDILKRTEHENIV